MEKDKNTSKNLYNKSLKYDLTIMIFFCIIGLLVKHFFVKESTEDGNSGPALATLWGYGLVIISILITMFITFALVSKLSNIENCGFLDFSKKLLFNSLSPFIILVLLLWVIVLNIMYFKTINKSGLSNQNRLPQEFIIAERLTSLLIFIQVIIVFKYIYDMLSHSKFSPNAPPKDCGISYPQTGFTKTLTFISIFMGIVTAVLISIMNIILAYFITDG